MGLKQFQKRVYQNKVAKGFNVTDVHKEFCLLYGEVAEAQDAYLKKKDNVGEELADVALYLFGLAEILGVDLEQELVSKMNINESRKYTQKDGIALRVEEP